MTLQDVQQADAQRIAEQDGIEVQYVPAATGTAVPVKAFINPGKLRTWKTDENRALQQEFTIQIAKVDVPVVVRNDDEIIIPAAWADNGGQEKRMRVAVKHDRDAAWWILGLKN